MDIVFEEKEVREEIFSVDIPKRMKDAKSVVVEEMQEQGIDVSDMSAFDFETEILEDGTKLFHVYHVKKELIPMKVVEKRVFPLDDNTKAVVEVSKNDPDEDVFAQMENAGIDISDRDSFEIRYIGADAFEDVQTSEFSVYKKVTEPLADNESIEYDIIEEKEKIEGMDGQVAVGKNDPDKDVFDRLERAGIDVSNKDEFEIRYVGADDIGGDQVSNYSVYRVKRQEVPYLVTREEVCTGIKADDEDIYAVVQRDFGLDIRNNDVYEVGYVGSTDDIYGPETHVSTYVVYKKSKVKIDNLEENKQEIKQENDNELAEKLEEIKEFRKALEVAKTPEEKSSLANMIDSKVNDLEEKISAPTEEEQRRAAEIDREIAELEERIKKASEEYDKLEAEFDQLIENQKAKLDNSRLLSDEEIKNINVDYKEKKQDIREQIIETQREAEEVRKEKEELTSERNDIPVDSRKEVLDRKREELQDELFDIIMKPTEEITAEDMVNIDKINTILDQIDILYFADRTEVKRGEEARKILIPEVKLEDIQRGIVTQPEKIAISEEQKVMNYKPLETPEDMKGIFGEETEEQINAVFPADEEEIEKEEDEPITVVDLENLEDKDAESIALYRDLDDDNQIYASLDIIDRFDLDGFDDEIDIMGDTCKKITEEEEDNIHREAKTADHEIEIEYIDVNLKEKEDEDDFNFERIRAEHPGELSPEFIVGVLGEGLPKDIIGAKEGDRLKACNIQTVKGLVDELSSGGMNYNVVSQVPWVYKVVGALPTVLKYPLAGVMKVYSKFHFWKNPEVKEALEEFQRRCSKLTPEALDVLHREYKGSVALQANVPAFNPLIFDAVRKYGLEEVNEMNEEISENYQRIMVIMEQIKALEEKLDNDDLSEVERAALENERQVLISEGAELVTEIVDLRRDANDILGGGIHGMSEDMKAVKSRMNVEGGRFANGFLFWHPAGYYVDTELNEEIGNYSQAMRDAIATGDDEEILSNFINFELLNMDSTEFKKVAGMNVSVGKKYYSALAQELDYNPDPFMRNLMTTIATTAALYNLYTSVALHKKIGEHNESLEKHNTEKDAVMDEVHGHGKTLEGHAKDYKDAYKEHFNREQIGKINTEERALLDRNDWRFGGRYPSEDFHMHEGYNSYYNNVIQRMEGILTRKGSDVTTLEELQKLSEETNKVYHEVLQKALDDLVKFDSNHSYDHQGLISALENALKNPDALLKAGKDQIESVEIGELLQGLDVADAELLEHLPHDVIASIANLGGLVGLTRAVTTTYKDKDNPQKSGNIGQRELMEERQKAFEEFKNVANEPASTPELEEDEEKEEDLLGDEEDMEAILNEEFEELGEEKDDASKDENPLAELDEMFPEEEKKLNEEGRTR